MLTSAARPCPSCRDPLQVHALPAHDGGTVEIDFCFACQGIWFDSLENQRLAPSAVATVFREIHQHRSDAHRPLARDLSCPQCRMRLTQGFDLVRSGRYITHRCERRHGRFSSFASFMIEKGFVRQLTKPEIADIARKVGVIHCSSCGAPVDLRKEDACSHCRSPLSLLDPQAVEKAMQRYAPAPHATPADNSAAVADAILAMERVRREEIRAGRGELATGVLSVDLVSVGLGLLGGLWSQ